MGYNELSDEDKLAQAIRFVAVGQPLPKALEEFLVREGLLEAITKPVRQ